jgi:hypothetical protein
MKIVQALPRPVIRLAVLRQFVLPSLAVGLALCAVVPPANAQVGSNGISMPQPNNPSTMGGPPPGIKQQPVKPAPPPPDALPGAVSRGGPAPVQGAPIADPTEALFDAINRGDIASARDAIDRGADLDGQNVLGMSPLDMSVDLGRNDITFLLLSLRNGDSGPGRRGSVVTTQGGPTAKPGSAHAQTGGKVPTASQTKAAARAPTTPPVKQAAQVPPAQPTAPRLFAGDGGTPNPGVGFLGFDNKH